MSLISFHNLSQAFGARDIFAGLSGSVPWGARLGLVGPNGIGKTTLLRVLAGQAPPSGGDVHVARDARLGYLRQEAVLAFRGDRNTVYQEMLTVFADVQRQEAALRRLEEAMAAGSHDEATLDQYGALQQAFEAAGGYDYEVRIRQVLSGLGFAEDSWSMPLRHCSGGEKTRALLARLLLEQPDLLILDEPTNHLDVAAVEWLEAWLRGWEGAMLIVSHDRAFLDNLVTQIWEMSPNGLESYAGNYSAYVAQREERWARREAEFEAVKARFLADLDFVKRNIARDSTTDRAKGLLRRLIRQVKAVEVGGTRALDVNWSVFMDQTGISGERWTPADVEAHIKALHSPSPRAWQPHMTLPPTRRSGRQVLRAKNLVVGYAGNPLFAVEELSLERGACAALIGPNGSGKTTFLRTLLGEIPPLAGKLALGASLEIAYFAQAHELLNPDNSVLDELMAHHPLQPGAARNHLARYLFRNDDVFKPVRALSGGERGRLALAVLALNQANFLLLDEPSNHLDLLAQEALEAALEDFDGTVLLVSHDRYLIDRLASQIWELRDGRLTVHRGNYQSYLVSQERVAAQTDTSPIRRPASLPARVNGAAQRLASAEARVIELEGTLLKMEQAMEAAGAAQAWDQLQSLSRDYHRAQARLAELIDVWEMEAASAEPAASGTA